MNKAIVSAALEVDSIRYKKITQAFVSHVKEEQRRVFSGTDGNNRVVVEQGWTTIHRTLWLFDCDLEKVQRQSIACAEKAKMIRKKFEPIRPTRGELQKVATKLVEIGIFEEKERTVPDLGECDMMAVEFSGGDGLDTKRYRYNPEFQHDQHEVGEPTTKKCKKSKKRRHDGQVKQEIL